MSVKSIYIYCTVILLVLDNVYCTKILADLLGGHGQDNKPLGSLGNLLPSLNFGIGIGFGNNKNMKTNQPNTEEYPYNGYDDGSSYGHPHGGPPGHQFGHSHGHSHGHGHGNYYPHKYNNKPQYPYYPEGQQPFYPNGQQHYHPDGYYPDYTTTQSDLFEPNYSYRPNYTYKPNYPSKPQPDRTQPNQEEYPDQQQNTNENANEEKPYTFSDNLKTTTPTPKTTPKLDYEIDIRFGNSNNTAPRTSDTVKTKVDDDSTEAKRGTSINNDSDKIAFPSDE